MKNLFNTCIKEYRENSARFVYDTLETRDVKVGLEIIKAHEAATDDRKNLDKGITVVPRTEKDLWNLNKKVNPNEIGKTKKVAEKSVEKKEITAETLTKKDKERVKKYIKNHPEYKRIASKKYEKPEEFAFAMRNFIEKPETAHGFLEHLKLIPNDLGNTGKIAFAGFALGSISTETGGMAALKEGLKWGGAATLLTHPIVTGALAHALPAMGKGIVWAGGIGIDVITEFIYNPGKFFDKIKQGENPIANDKLARQLVISQSPMVLRGQGMIFSKELNTSLDFMKANPTPKNIPPNVREDSAKFLLQTENLSREISDNEVSEISNKIWNKETVSDEDYRKVLVMKARTKVKNFFSKAKQEDDLGNSINALREEQKNLSSDDKNKLKEIGINNLSEIVGVGSSNFAEMTKEKKHGIRRALSNMTGTSLITYILIFLVSKGAMRGSDIFQKGKEKTADVRKKLVEKPISTIAGGIVWPFKKVGSGLWNLMSMPARKWRQNRIVEKVGKGSFSWSNDKIEAYNKLSKKEKQKVVKKLQKIYTDKKNNVNNELETLRKKHKVKRNKWTLWLTKTVDTKKMKTEDAAKYAEIQKGLAELKGGKLKSAKTLNETTEWKAAFSDIETSNNAVYKILFP